jgi:hypothetical protein
MSTAAFILDDSTGARCPVGTTPIRQRLESKSCEAAWAENMLGDKGLLSLVAFGVRPGRPVK